MMRAGLLVFLCVCMVRGEERSIPLLVSTEWLSAHSGDENLVVLHVGFTRKEFAIAHIPGARFLWFNGIAPSTPDASTEMPTVQEAERVLGELGVATESNIVLVFSGANMTPTARAFLALSYFGRGNRTAFLDGGFEQWKGEKRRTESGVPVVSPGKPRLTTHPEVIVDADWLKERLSSSEVTIVDARARPFFDGTGGGLVRQGHIKGARSIPFTVLADSTNRIRPLPELRRVFDEAGIAPGSTVVSYCHVGQQASLVYLTALLLGYDAKVYDGSFEDWNTRDESYPVEKAPPPSR